MKKRGYLTAAALAALMLVAAGCGSKSSNGKVSLSVNYYNGAISKTAIANTKKHFKNYDITFKQIPANEDFDTKLKASLSSSSAPDITAINSNLVDYIPYKDKFVNLADYGTKKLASQYVTWKWDSTFATKNYQIAMPIDIGPTAFQYHAANFKAAGLPTDPAKVSELIKTDDDWMAAAKQMKEKTGKKMFQSAVALLEIQERKMSQDIYNSKGKLTMANGEYKKAWDFAATAYKKGYTYGAKGNSADGVNATQKGSFSSSVAASWGTNDLKEDGVKNGEWLIAKAPGTASNYGGSYLAVIKKTAHPKEAAAVVKYLTNKENQQANYKELALFPTVKSLYTKEFVDATDPLYGDEHYNKYFVDAANATKYVKANPKTSAVETIFGNEMTLVETQNKNPDKAYADALKKAKALQ